MRGRGTAAMVAVVSLVVLVAGTPAAVGQDLTDLAELIEDPAAYTDSIILVEGELVGDYGFRRTGFMWTQLNQDSYAASPIAAGGLLSGANRGIAIRMESELAEGIGEPGGYRHRGPIVRVTGIWKYHDSERQGESYLDVLGLVRVEGDLPLSDRISWIAVAIGVVLLLGAGVLTFVYRRARDEV